MPECLIDIADQSFTFEAGTKGRDYYAVYDRYFGDLARPRATVLELGVYQGQSTKVLASYFKDGKIIAIDSDDRKIDFSAFPNIVFECADQRNAKQLTAICERHALNEIDIVIDDAAHIGSWSRASYETLLPGSIRAGCTSSKIGGRDIGAIGRRVARFAVREACSVA